MIKLNGGDLKSMSLQSAAAGFGAWCEKNNVKFNIPLLGNISIGAKHEKRDKDNGEYVPKTC